VGLSFYIHGSKGPRSRCLPARVPGVFKDLTNLSGRPEAPPALPAGSVRHPGGRNIRPSIMTDPQVFYNRERSVGSPGGKVTTARSTPWSLTYILMKLPGSSQMEYLIIDSFHPTEERQYDRLGWPPDATFLTTEKCFSMSCRKRKLIYGPNQISAMNRSRVRLFRNN